MTYLEEPENESFSEKHDHAETGDVDFSGLILGFSSAALYYLGETSVEGKPQGSLNLPLARQNLDIVKMLQVKSRGNLTSDEARLIEQVIADLSQKFP